MALRARPGVEGGGRLVSDGFWTVSTPPLVPGLHYYALIIDGAGSATADDQRIPDAGEGWLRCWITTPWTRRPEGTTANPPEPGP